VVCSYHSFLVVSGQGLPDLVKEGVGSHLGESCGDPLISPFTLFIYESVQFQANAIPRGGSLLKLIDKDPDRSRVVTQSIRIVWRGLVPSKPGHPTDKKAIGGFPILKPIIVGTYRQTFELKRIFILKFAKKCHISPLRG
jgi:hypothetical protein